MADGQFTPVEIPPGVILIETEYAAGPRWVSTNGIRWQQSRWEKRGGFESASDDLVEGVSRGMFAWIDSMSIRRLAVATHKRLYNFRDGLFENITPFVGVTTSLANAVTTINGNTTVVIAFTAHKQQNGDNVRIYDADTVGGITLEGPYEITVINANSFSVAHQVAATSSVGPTGSIKVEVFRGTLTNPFSTTNASHTVAVADSAHGRGLGDFVFFFGASAVGGLTVSGEYEVTLVVDANNYQIQHASAASSTAGPGGGTVTYEYEMSIGRDNSIASYGYGVGTYGASTWSTPRTVSVQLLARTWSLDNSLDVLIANVRGGSIYEWIPGRSDRATILNNAPATADWVFVTEELHVHALNPDGAVLKDQWSDIADRYTWAVDPLNDARSRRVGVGSFFIGGAKFHDHQAVVWSDEATFAVLYTQDDYVYTLRQIGAKTGIIGPRAWGDIDGRRYWMGKENFYVYDGASCNEAGMNDVRDFVFKDINRNQGFKCFTRVQERFGEICFYYCSQASEEIDRYVAIYPRERRSSAGAVCGYGTDQPRSAWQDAGVFPEAYGMDVDGQIYEHDKPGVVNGDGAALPWQVRSGALELQDGNVALDVPHMIPDMKRITGTVELNIYTRDYPQGTETTNGPFEITSTSTVLDFSPRVNGRQFSIEFVGDEVDGDARGGKMRFAFSPAGER